MRKYALIAIGSALILAGCKEPNKSKQDGIAHEMEDLPAEVVIETLRSRTFAHEIVCNGKVVSQRQADLRFKSATEPIAAVMVKNGSRVKKGQTIARLMTSALENKLKQAKSRLEQSELEMKDVLIGQGYNTTAQNNVPESVWKLAQVKSGYAQNHAAYELARMELEDATMKAPFDGIIANLSAKAFCMPDASTPVCRIISTGGLSVEFSVLETELQVLGTGTKVEIMPYALPDTKVYGNITEINPLVDEKGLVKIRADINGDKRLFEGMNVRIRIQRDVPKQYVVPKTAIVLRSGRQVMFTLEDGKAVWNYVTTGLENLDSYTVIGETLKEGMQVIVSGNQNLAHHSPVIIVKPTNRK